MTQPNDSERPSLRPHLIVRDADAAIAFYTEALGAKVVTRFYDAVIEMVVHAHLELPGGGHLTLAEESHEWKNDSPLHLNGSPVVLHLDCGDPDALATRMVEHGSTVIFPIADQFYGSRAGRLRDPFGHLWILSKVTEALDDAEVQRRIDRFHDK